MSAQVAGEALHDYLSGDNRSPTLLSEFNRLASNLGSTFSDRLKSKLEVKRSPAPPEEESGSANMKDRFE